MLVWAPAAVLAVIGTAAAPSTSTAASVHPPIGSPVAVLTTQPADAALDDALANAATTIPGAVIARDAVKHAEREAQKLGLRCHPDDASCTAKIGVLAGAAAVVVPKVSGATYSLVLVDVAAGKAIATAGPFAKKSDAAAALGALFAPSAHEDATPVDAPPPPHVDTPHVDTPHVDAPHVDTPHVDAPPLPHAEMAPVAHVAATPSTTATPTTTSSSASTATATNAAGGSLAWPVAIGAGVVAAGCGAGALFAEAALHDDKSTAEQRAPITATGRGLVVVGIAAGVVAAGAAAYAFATP